MLSDVERLRGGRADGGIRINKRTAHDDDDGRRVGFERRLGGVPHDLGKSEADALALTTVGRGHGLLEVPDDFAQNGLAELPARIRQTAGRGLQRNKDENLTLGKYDGRPGTHLALLDTRAGEGPDDELHEDREDLADGSGSVLDERLPDVNGGLANDAGGILANDVETSEDSVPALASEGVDEGLLAVVVREADILLVVLAIVVLVRLSADSRDPEEKVANELDGAGKERSDQSSARKVTGMLTGRTFVGCAS